MEQKGRSTRQGRIRRAPLAGAMVLLLGATACGPAEAGNAEAGEPEDSYVRTINVQVAPIETQSFTEEIRLTAVAMANQDVQIEADERGTIRALFVDRGDRVEEGDSIAKIDDRVLLAQVEQARAAAELAQQTWERRRRLWEEDQVGSEIAYLEAKFAAEQSAAALKSLEERLADTLIRAPFSGIFDERYVDIGATVSPGEAIGRMVDLNPIRVVAGVPERYASDVRVGTPAEMAFEALDGRRYSARVRYVGATVDPQNRTFGIEVQVRNPGLAIKPQMVANLSVTRRSLDDVIVAPQDALVRTEDGYRVFVVVDRGGEMVAEARDVEVGPSRRNLVVIEEGVSQGEQLIVVGHRSVADGDHVNVVEG